MSEQEIPQAWVGREVEASILNPSQFSQFGIPTSLTTMRRTGTLEAVNTLGIVASLWYDPKDERQEPPASTFYPWSSVVWIRPVEEEA